MYMYMRTIVRLYGMSTCFTAACKYPDPLIGVVLSGAPASGVAHRRVCGALTIVDVLCRGTELDVGRLQQISRVCAAGI